MTAESEEYPLDFGQQVLWDDPNPSWVFPIIGGLAFGAFMLMCILGQAPWQAP